MIKAKEKYEQETKGMSLEDKLKWVEDKIFWIAIDNYIQDRESYRFYCNLSYELKNQLKEQTLEVTKNENI